MHRHLALAILVTAFVVVGSGCGLASVQPTVAPTPAQAQQPTSTPSPLPTNTPSPSNTPEATLTPTSPPTGTPTPVPSPTNTPVPSNVPPVIEILDIPGNLHAGSPITVSLSIFDWDGDDFQVGVEQQLGMGDKYRGGEYVTAQELEELDFDEERVFLQARFPGNYRILVVATDTNGTTEQALDLPIVWAPGENPFQLRGVAVDTWGPPDWIIDSRASIEEIVDNIVHLNGNSLEIAPDWNMPSKSSGDIARCTKDMGCYSPTDSELKDWIEIAHSAGLSVVLKPHLVVGSFNRNTVSYEQDTWHIDPIDHSKWWESYTRFVLHYARIAAESEVEIFSIGNELVTFHGQQHLSNWQNLIDGVAGETTSALTYADPIAWTNEHRLARFNSSLDFSGVNLYYKIPTTYSDGQEVPPTVSFMEHSMMAQISHNLSTIDQYDNPIIVLEMGIQSFDGAANEPWIWSRVIDRQEQVDYQEALFRALTLSDLDIAGVFAWKNWIQPEAELYRGPQFDFRLDPANEMYRLWFSN